jgi:hypothetical protein
VVQCLWARPFIGLFFSIRSDSQSGGCDELGCPSPPVWWWNLFPPGRSARTGLRCSKWKDTMHLSASACHLWKHLSKLEVFSNYCWNDIALPRMVLTISHSSFG